jgi:hypothetical protein
VTVSVRLLDLGDEIFISRYRRRLYLWRACANPATANLVGQNFCAMKLYGESGAFESRGMEAY